MRRFVKINNEPIQSQAASIIHDTVQYFPIFLHATIDQDHPVGHKRTFLEHTHDFYHIVLYTKGHGEYSKEGVFHVAQPGTCVLVHPGQHHDFVSHWEKSVYSEITFTFQTSQEQPLRLSFEELLSLYVGTDISLNADATLSSDQTNVLHNRLCIATDHLSTASQFSTYHAQYDLTSIFNFLITYTVSTNKGTLSKTPFTSTKDYIQEHYFEQFTVDELAAIAGFSKGYFFRGFKQQFGVSPLAYQQTIRVEAAKTLLKTTNLRCNEIAWRVGYSDVYFFHRIFKKHTSLTPVQYRKKPLH